MKAILTFNELKTCQRKLQILFPHEESVILCTNVMLYIITESSSDHNLKFEDRVQLYGILFFSYLALSQYVYPQKRDLH